MKNSFYTLLLAVLLLLVGCHDDGNNDEMKNDQEASTKETTTNEKESSEEQEVTVEENDHQFEGEETPEEEIEPLYQLDTDTWSLIPLQPDTNDQVVLLTIDDAPADNALEMAKTLTELDAPAIFFVNGHSLEADEEKEQLQAIYDMGFSIGNHTYYHQKLSDADEEIQKKEIQQLNKVVEEILGEKPAFFRAPHGDNTEYAISLVEEEGMLLMNWTYGYDYFEPYMDADKLKEAMISGKGPEVGVDYSLLKPGAILLMHDRDWTAKALAGIVNGLRDQGYDFVDPKTIKLP